MVNMYKISVPTYCVDLVFSVLDALCQNKVLTHPDTGSGTEINNRKTICYGEIVPDRSAVPALSFMAVSDLVGPPVPQPSSGSCAIRTCVCVCAQYAEDNQGVGT